MINCILFVDLLMYNRFKKNFTHFLTMKNTWRSDNFKYWFLFGYPFDRYGITDVRTLHFGVKDSNLGSRRSRIFTLVSLHWIEHRVNGINILPLLLSWLEYPNNTLNLLNCEYFSTFFRTVFVSYSTHK